MKYIVWLIGISMSYAQIPAYYSQIDFEADSQTLYNQLSYLVTVSHTNPLPFTSNTTMDTWDLMKISDEDENNPQNVLLIYGSNDSDESVVNDRTRSKDLSCHGSSCYGKWNREHVYSKSYAIPLMDTDYIGIATDVHNLRACDSSTNSSRSNRTFTDGDSPIACTVGSDDFFPGNEWKGDIARIIMYMYLRWGDQADANRATVGSNSYHADMPDLFLQWNAIDPVSPLEIQRNDSIYAYQGNRNPFIDNPHIAHLLWGGPDAENTWNLSTEDSDSIDPHYVFYPNPSSEKIYVRDQIIETHIIDLFGRKIISSSAQEIDIQSLERGQYIVLLRDNEGNLYQKPLLKY